MESTNAKYRAIIVISVICILLLLNNCWNANAKKENFTPGVQGTKATNNTSESPKKMEATQADEDQLDFLHMQHIGSGMPMGFNIIVLGVLISWLGIEASFKLEGSGKGFSMGLATASPGVFLIIAGAVIILTCLIKPYSHTRSSGENVVKASNIGENAKKEDEKKSNKGTTFNSVSFSESSKGIDSFWKKQKLRYETASQGDGAGLQEWFDLLYSETNARKSILSSIIKDLSKSEELANLKLNEQQTFYEDLFKDLDEIKARSQKESRKVVRDDVQGIMSKYTDLSAKFK